MVRSPWPTTPPLTAVFRDLAPRTAPIAEPEMEHHIPTSEVYPRGDSQRVDHRAHRPTTRRRGRGTPRPRPPGAWAGSPVPYATPRFIDAGEPLPAELNDETEVDEPSAVEQTLRLDMPCRTPGQCCPPENAGAA